MVAILVKICQEVIKDGLSLWFLTDGCSGMALQLWQGKHGQMHLGIGFTLALLVI